MYHICPLNITKLRRPLACVLLLRPLKLYLDLGLDGRFHLTAHTFVILSNVIRILLCQFIGLEA